MRMRTRPRLQTHVPVVRNGSGLFHAVRIAARMRHKRPVGRLCNDTPEPSGCGKPCPRAGFSGKGAKLGLACPAGVGLGAVFIADLHTHKRLLTVIIAVSIKRASVLSLSGL